MNTISGWRGREKPATAHYVAILQPRIFGEWRVLSPDVPECETYGFTVRDTTFAAEAALARRRRARTFPRPRGLDQIECDGEWLTRNGVNLSMAHGNDGAVTDQIGTHLNLTGDVSPEQSPIHAAGLLQRPRRSSVLPPAS